MSEDKNKPQEPKIKNDRVVLGVGQIDTELLEAENLVKNEGPTLSFAIKEAMGSTKKTQAATRIGFTEDPTLTESYAGIFKLKKRLLPDSIIKMIRVQNHLVASILRARANTLSMFGHIKKDRFDIGIDVDVRKEFEDHLSDEQLVKVNERIDRFKKLLINCGKTDGLEENEKMTLAEYLYLQIQDGISLGRFATEIVREGKNGAFNRFRPVDAGTIYKTIRKGEGAAGVRASGIRELQRITGNKVLVEEIDKDQYSYVQVIGGFAKQAFSADELIVHNLYPSNDIDYNGYPVTPIDTCISSITTHLSIDAYNKLYFQNGRAAKGMLVINSDEISQNDVNNLKKEFMASINNVGNSFRVPVFGIGSEDKVQWMPMVSSSGDGEFQFLYDAVARNILSTFNMSPDELPGYGHLSRGTNQQSLSEGQNEFKLTASRDTGLRPLILQLQSFFNNKLFPIMDPELAQLCTIKLSGLDAQSKEQESLRIQQDMPIHMDYDGVMAAVDKEPVGPRMGGKVPFNERQQIIMDKYLNVSDVMSQFMESPTASADSMLRYKRDPFFIQSVQIMMQTNPDAVKAYFASKPYSMDILKMMIQDYLDEDVET